LLTQQLDEITYKKDNIISMLTQQITDDKENNKKIIRDLKTNLDKQTTETDKLSASSSLLDRMICSKMSCDHFLFISILFYLFHILSRES